MSNQKVRLQYEDFRRIKKGEPFYNASKRWYISETTGVVISKSTFQRRATKISIEPVVKEKPTKQKRTRTISTASKRSNYRDKLERYTNMLNEANYKQYGIEGTLTTNQVRQSSEFKQLYQDLKSKDNSRNGKKAKALVMLGLRDEEAEYDVGDTP